MDVGMREGVVDTELAGVGRAKGLFSVEVGGNGNVRLI
jgi:hypothetical protein